MRLLETAIATMVCMLACTAGPRSPSSPDHRARAASPSLRVEGIVVDSAGQSISAATIVQSFCPNGPASPCYDNLQLATCSDRAGRFSFDLPTVGHYAVVALVHSSIVGFARIVIPQENGSTLRLIAGNVAKARSLRPPSGPCVPSSE